MYKRVRRLLPLLTVGIALLSGCSPEPSGNGSAGPPASHEAVAGSLSVYADETYKTALTRIFRTIGNQYPKLNLEWAASPQEGDVIITDCIPESESGQYRVLDAEAEELEDVLGSEWLLRDSRGIIGLPLFLRVDSYWYDNLLYQRSETALPLSLEEFRKSPLLKDCPAICDANDMNSLFWSTVAPLYLSQGGTAEEIGNGEFRSSALLPALVRLRELCDSGMLVIQERASERFTSNNAMFWTASFASIADVRFNMSNLSDVSFSPALIYSKQDTPYIALRADILAVREEVDSSLVKILLESIYDSKTLIRLCSDSKVPLACRISFGSNSVPELVNTSYTVLSAPSLKIGYVACRWDAATRADILQAVAAVARGTSTPRQAVDTLCPGK